jgi:hypothetical protein
MIHLVEVPAKSFDGLGVGEVNRPPGGATLKGSKSGIEADSTRSADRHGCAFVDGGMRDRQAHAAGSTDDDHVFVLQRSVRRQGYVSSGRNRSILLVSALFVIETVTIK